MNDNTEQYINVLVETQDLWKRKSKLHPGICIICEKSIKRGKICSCCSSNLKRRGVKEKLVEYKGGCCQKCGYKKCFRALTFHHIDPSKKDFVISNNHCKSLSSLKKEVDKCELLCHNCHTEEHDKIDLNRLEITMKRWKYYIFKKEENRLFKVKKICEKCAKKFKPVHRNQKHCSKECSSKVANKPTRDMLQKLIWEMPTVKVAKIYGVCDKAVEKWCKKHGLSKPPRGYWAKIDNKIPKDAGSIPASPTGK